MSYISIFQSINYILLGCVLIFSFLMRHYDLEISLNSYQEINVNK